MVSLYWPMLFLTDGQVYFILITFPNGMTDFRNVHIFIFLIRMNEMKCKRLSCVRCKFHSFMVLNLVAFLPAWRINGWFAVIVYHAVCFFSFSNPWTGLREMSTFLSEQMKWSVKACHVSHVSFRSYIILNINVVALELPFLCINYSI